jgi:hypothetical protein
MSPILPIGDFLPVDAARYLINPCRYELIIPPWSDVVAAIKAAYLHTLGRRSIASTAEGLSPKAQRLPGYLILTLLRWCSGRAG